MDTPLSLSDLGITDETHRFIALHDWHPAVTVHGLREMLVRTALLACRLDKKAPRDAETDEMTTHLASIAHSTDVAEMKTGHVIQVNPQYRVNQQRIIDWLVLRKVVVGAKNHGQPRDTILYRATLPAWIKYFSDLSRAILAAPKKPGTGADGINKLVLAGQLVKLVDILTPRERRIKLTSPAKDPTPAAEPTATTATTEEQTPPAPEPEKKSVEAMD